MAKKAVGAKVEEAVLDRLRNAIFWIGRGLTINGLVEEAIVEKCQQLEKQFNKGKPFDDRTSELPRSNKKDDETTK